MEARGVYSKKNRGGTCTTTSCSTVGGIKELRSALCVPCVELGHHLLPTSTRVVAVARAQVWRVEGRRRRREAGAEGIKPRDKFMDNYQLKALMWHTTRNYELTQAAWCARLHSNWPEASSSASSAAPRQAASAALYLYLRRGARSAQRERRRVRPPRPHLALALAPARKRGERVAGQQHGSPAHSQQPREAPRWSFCAASSRSGILSVPSSATTPQISPCPCSATASSLAAWRRQR